MNKYNYKAKDEAGKTTKGVVEAANDQQAVKLLRSRKLLIIDLRLQRGSVLPTIQIFSRVRMDDKVNFTRQLSTMISSGLALTEALSILENQAKAAMAKVVSDVLNQVEGGGSLGDAMAKHPKAFDSVYVALVRAGESAGILDNVLDRLAGNLEKRRDFGSKIKGAMIYPAIIVSGMVIVGVIMLVFVIPRLTVLYQEFSADLPLSTKILLGLSKFMTKYWWVILTLFLAAIYPLRILIKVPGFKKVVDEIYFKLPAFGKLRRQIMFTEFTRTLGLLVGSGVLMVDALEIVRKSMGSPVYEEAVDKATAQVKKGFPLAVSLARTEAFPPLLPQMVAVGEETGKVDEILGKISSYFEQEAEVLVKGLTTALEPLIMILMGIGVGFLVIAVIMPIYNLTSQF